MEEESYDKKRCGACGKDTLHARRYKGNTIKMVCCVCAVNALFKAQTETDEEESLSVFARRIAEVK